MRGHALHAVATLVAALVGVAASASAGAVTLANLTTPSTGVAGVSNVNLSGSGYPAGAIAPADVAVRFSTSCGGAPVAETRALSVTTVIGSTRRVGLQVPASLASGTYFASLSGRTTGAVAFDSGSSCSRIAVTRTSTTLSACIPGSSLGINAPVGPGPVTAIVPGGAWAFGDTGIRLVPLEGAGITSSIATPDIVNSCAANPATGQSVCVANSRSVYLIDAAGALTDTLTSGATGVATFSGGACANCGVAINALTNQAVINMGLAGSPSGTGLQVLNLANKTFQAPFPLAHRVTENISIDPTRGYVLSPNEGNVYDLIRFDSSAGALQQEFAMPVFTGGEFNSAAEDCTTGIALAAQEFTDNVFITDLTQAVFTPGTPGGWSAPARSVTLDGFYSAGVSAVTVAPGSSHLAIATGEFGGSSFAVLKLPSRSGSGTPTIEDHAFVSGICDVNAGLDPHTVSAYTSGNDGKAYGVMASGGPPPDKLVVLDLAAILAAPRFAGSNTVILTGDSLCPDTAPSMVRFVPLPR